MASFKTLYKYLLVLGLAMILVKCSVEKNTDTTRFYHSMTAKYNIYFNGYESFKAGIDKILNSYQDDYAELLMVFEYSDPASVAKCSADMERAIQKASKLISLKSITSKPELKDKSQLSDKEKELLDKKEYNEWVDDSYLLIGKARFYKHEFNEATSLFNYCITEANSLAIKKESVIWLARVYNETGDYNESLRLLNELDINSDFSKAMSRMYYTSLADLYIKQKRYSEAIDPLARAVDLASRKRTRYRLTYLLAQLYEQEDDGANATSRYREVVKMNPPYEVEFNARINIAGVFDLNTGDQEEMRKELNKMLRDAKNKDFQDQIYYALGNLSMKEGNESEALDYYKKSASSLSRNPNQKGRSYLALAEYYYDKPDYMKAGMYYDSSIIFLNQKYPDYQSLITLSQSLNALVSQLTIIQTQDSLQRIAKMSPAERDAHVASMIAKIIKDESEGKVSEYSDRYNMGQFYENERRFQGNIEQEGKWYFYNQAALTFGRTEFRRRWGDRTLEDNWRRSNKTRVIMSQSTTGADENSQAVSDSSSPLIDYKNPEFYFRNLPLTDSLINISNEKIATALLYAGKAYSDYILDPIKATETFETLISRFPDNVLIPEAMFNIYRINKDINNSKAETYRQRLLEKYTDSEFALILSDPAYYEKKLADMKKAEKIYEDAYNSFKEDNFKQVIAICDKALLNYPKDLLAPKFLLLRAYSIGRVVDERQFKEELNILIKLWPGTEESKKAAEIIAYLNQEIPELKVEEDKEIAAELYKSDTTANHVFALIILDPAFNINLATFDVISYNIDNYTNKNYRTLGALIDNKYIMITVAGFTDLSQALDYFSAFSTEQHIRNPSKARMITFLINDENQKVLEQDKDPGRYQIFFMENYLK